jgi:hypothetical protein
MGGLFGSLGVYGDDLAIFVLLHLHRDVLVERNIEEHLHLSDLLGVMGGLQEYLLYAIDDGH